MTQTLDLKKMGLIPMGEAEMQETDGGNPWIIAAIWAVAWEVASNPTAHAGSFTSGWNAAH
jgi:hypothetical protein